MRIPLLKFDGGHLGDNCIQNFHLRRYIGYTVRNDVLLQRAGISAVSPQIIVLQAAEICMPSYDM